MCDVNVCVHFLTINFFWIWIWIWIYSHQKIMNLDISFPEGSMWICLLGAWMIWYASSLKINITKLYFRCLIWELSVLFRAVDSHCQATRLKPRQCWQCSIPCIGAINPQTVNLHHFTNVWQMDRFFVVVSLQWRYNERDCVSNHRRLNYLINGFFRRRSKKTLKLRVSGLCEGIPRWTVDSSHTRGQ